MAKRTKKTCNCPNCGPSTYTHEYVWDGDAEKHNWCWQCTNCFHTREIGKTHTYTGTSKTQDRLIARITELFGGTVEIGETMHNGSVWVSFVREARWFEGSRMFGTVGRNGKIKLTFCGAMTQELVLTDLAAVRVYTAKH